MVLSNKHASDSDSDSDPLSLYLCAGSTGISLLSTLLCSRGTGEVVGSECQKAEVKYVDFIAACMSVCGAGNF